MTNKVILTLQIEKAIKKEATVLAAKQGISRSELVRRAIKKYIDEAEIEE